MLNLPEKLRATIDSFRRLPGIGEKTAMRLAMMLTTWNSKSLREFGENISALSDIERCPVCGLFSNGGLCDICLSDFRRSIASICVVESVPDAMAIEACGLFKGTYHVLGGVLNPLLGVGPCDLTIDKLMARINENNLSEVILAINPSVEGDATCSYLHQALPTTVKVERIGFGVPMGGSLEYLDPLTIKKALEYRRSL